MLNHIETFPFEHFDPREGKRLQLLNEDGELTPLVKDPRWIDDEQALRAYQTMVLTREADEWAVSLNRQGRLPTYPPVKGQEANAIGAIMALNQDDWFVQAFRELGGLLLRNVPLRQHYLFFLGHEMGSHYDPEKYAILPISIPIATQLLHAVGVAFAERYKRTNRVVIAFSGDGGTSQGDFHEALNFAGVWKAPVIFYVQNNQYAISVSRKKQTASKTIAEKAFAYGFDGIQIDGNDVFATFVATKKAAEKARNGGGPTLIEGYTYRLGAHTTADDPTRYRADEEVAQWNTKDPLLRLEKYLLRKKMLTDQEVVRLKEASKNQAQEAFEEAEHFQRESLTRTYSFMFEEMPPVLEEQLARRTQLDGGE